MKTFLFALLLASFASQSAFAACQGMGGASAAIEHLPGGRITFTIDNEGKATMPKGFEKWKLAEDESAIELENSRLAISIMCND